VSYGRFLLVLVLRSQGRIKTVRTAKPWTLSIYNLPTDRARELFQSPKEAKSLLGSIFKNPGIFGFELFGRDVTTGGG